MNTGATADDGIRDAALLERLDKLNVAVISDALDMAGARHQVVRGSIHPLAPGVRVAGYVAPVRIVEVDEPPKGPDEAYRGELEALDALAPGDVMVTNAAAGAAFWGELVTSAARHRGAVGFIGETFARDVTRLLAMGFPVFVAGTDPRDSNGRLEVVDIGNPVVCGGVMVSRGDLVMADGDGIVAVPRALAEQVIAEAEAKVEREAEMRASLLAGTPITEAFATHRVL
jgi:4-hydroxy-4-methyl-2-oxoglutarate aldolase